MEWLSVKSHKIKINFLVSAFLILILAVIFFPACKAGPSSGSPTTPSQGGTYEGGIRLTLVSGWPYTSSINDLLKVYVERINKEGKGKVFIDYLGGPEITPITEAVGLVRNGVYDIAYSAPGYYAGLCPESVMLHYAPRDPVLLRQIGVTAWADELHRQKLGVTFVGILARGENFAIISKKPITSANFSGILMHSLPIFQMGITYLGAGIATLDVSEFYLALQTGVVDAVPCPMASVPYEYQLFDVAQYMLRPVMPIVGTANFLVNAKCWDGLPEDVRKLMTDKMVEIEREVLKHGDEVTSTDTAKLLEKGMKISELPSAEAKKFIYAFTDYSWEEFSKRYPEWQSRLYKLCQPYLGQ